MEVEDRLGLRPDSVLQERDRPLYDQIDEVLAGIAPVEEALRDLLSDGRDIGCVLQVVRYLNDADAPERETLPLGFGFRREALQLLARLDVRTDVDEYDCALGDE